MANIETRTLDESARSKLAHNTLLFDIVVGILALSVKGRRTKQIPERAVYNSFYQLKEKYPDIFSDIDFECIGEGKYHSRRLEGLFFQIGAWGLMGSSYGRESYFTLDSRTAKELITFISREKDKTFIPQLKVLYRDFNEFMANYSAPRL